MVDNRSVMLHNDESLSLQVGHIKDLGLDANANDVRVYATRAAQASGAPSMLNSILYTRGCMTS
jgi:hypothetical protein